MNCASDPIRWAEPRLIDLIENAERRAGSRMVAYDVVGRAIGRSPRWLRRVLGRAEGVELSGRDVFAIADAYRALCELIEADTETRRARAAALRGEDHAALEGALALDRVRSGRAVGSEGGAS